MAGIYIHIPFCKKRCLYCDFYSTTRLARRDQYVNALLREIEARKNEASEPIRTIYIGGGTPSQLTYTAITDIIRAIGTNEAEEITMELNPGDADPEYLKQIRAAGVNRLSIGIQSFQDELLSLVGRRHNAAQAIQAVQMAQQEGFDNLSIDLMYALPTQTMEQWKADIETAIQLRVQHISCYGLMYEAGTKITRLVEIGQLVPIDEETENRMYDYLCERLKKAGYVHYEVSNFALPGYESKHNSSYWDGTPYIGVGAGAHSYIGETRSWNPCDLDAYIDGRAQREYELLTAQDRYNERIMLSLRTSRGIEVTAVEATKAEELVQRHLLRKTDDGRIVATQQGIHILNRIIEELMI